MCNEHFVPLSIRPEDTYIIFPYDVKNGKAEEIIFSDFQERFPLAASYLARHRNRIESEVQTLPLRFPSLDKEETWHLFTRANNHNAVYRKICVPMTTQDPQHLPVAPYRLTFHYMKVSEMGLGQETAY